MIRYINMRGIIRILKQSRPNSSSTLTATSLNNTLTPASNDSTKRDFENKIVDSEDKPTAGKNIRSKLVSSVFESLKMEEIHVTNEKDELDLLISNAENVNSLLSSITNKVSRQEALKIVSVLADWTCSGRCNASDFQNDKRFLILCQILGKPSDEKRAMKPKPVIESDDLATVLGVTGDDEAAKIIGNISLQQMIKVISSLGSRKRRSLPILRSLAFNIAKCSEKTNIKQGADILYAAAQLNFYDEVLFEKICADLCECIMDNTKRAVIGSISTSLGLLKYKDTELLNLLSDWVVKNFSICHTQDLVSLLLTLATVNHEPQSSEKLFQKLVQHLSSEEVSSATIWLEVVWSLVILNKATHEHIASVLSPAFLERLFTISSDDIGLGWKLKLLNINGAARLKAKNYKGPLLDLSEEKWNVTLQRTKEKQALVVSVIDTLSNLVPSSVYLLTNINSGMGYYIDGQCLMDANLSPLPLVDKKTGQLIDRSNSRGTKVAILVLDYHDMTRGQRDPTGVACLAKELTVLQGYKVLTVDYVNFSPRDKLVSRVKYLKELLRTTVQSS